ncbi:MAG: thiol reductant ABC exporter subunit CydD [Acidobacteriota bacterium]|nr:thiol reductant ABC exporter subunit CydD [Acidobacteriota bacterium]
MGAADAAARPRPTRVDCRLARESAAARPHFAAAGVLGIATAGLVVLQAALLAHVIASVAVAHAGLAAERAWLVGLAVVFIARAAVAGAFELSGRLAAARVLADLRRRLAEQLLLVRPGAVRRERSGELAAAAVQGVDGLEAYFAGYLPSLMLAVAVPVAVLIWVTPIDPLVALIFAVTIPVLVGFMILIGLGAQSRTRSRWQALTLLSGHFVDAVRGLETLRIHRRELAQTQALADVGERYRDETMGTLRLAFVSALVLELCAMLGTGLAAASVGVQLSGGHLQLDAGLTVLLLAPEMYGPLRQVGQQFHATADGLAAAGQLLDVLDAATRPAAGSVAGAARTPDPRTEPIRFEGVSFSYPDSQAEVLRGLDLTLSPGEFMAVVGPSGAGKSTLAALALRLCDPTSGSVSCGGVDLLTVPADAWRAQTAWVPQRAKLFADTLAANIALAAPGASMPEILRAAERAGLRQLVDALPDGLATRVGDGGRRLSAGEAQRVGIARAFLADSPLVVLDEPTANLDETVAAEVSAAILELAGGRTLLLITHDLGLAARADRCLRLPAPVVMGVTPRQADTENETRYRIGSIEGAASAA